MHDIIFFYVPTISMTLWALTLQDCQTHLQRSVLMGPDSAIQQTHVKTHWIRSGISIM